MITRLRLHNWRAYENLDLELGPGATFIVAPNGIGKTSLIMALAWGLFGDVSQVRAMQEIRGDADSATVDVEVRLSSGVELRIVRSVTRKGQMNVNADFGGTPITSSEELDAVLTEEFGAEPRVLAKLTVMIHGGSVETTDGEFELRDHLAGVFGVTPLFDAAKAAKTFADSATSVTRKLKTVRRTEQKERAELEAELHSLETELAQARERRQEAIRVRDETTSMMQVSLEWSRYRASVKQRQQVLASIAQRAYSLIDCPVKEDSVVKQLEEAESMFASAMSVQERNAAAARGKTELIQGAVAQLVGAETVCPTCLRPLSEHDALQAESEHRSHLRQLTSAIEAAEGEAQRYRELIGNVRALLQEVRDVPTPLLPESSESEGTSSITTAEPDAKQRDIDELDQRLATLEASKRSVQSALQDLEEADRIAVQLEDAYRQEAVGFAAHQALESTGKSIMRKYIEPLAQEVEIRWKKVFGTGGLDISPEGHISRKIGSRVLSFESLSGGEKVWAQLLTRLLVTSASTRAPFVWLDEPLEHLDPRLRKIVAGTLAKATSGVGLRQVIVTTYENELARQLMEDVRSASLLYVTTSP
jgi:DNA repair exonuclease SbcCD ATPase subunit